MLQKVSFPGYVSLESEDINATECWAHAQVTHGLEITIMLAQILSQFVTDTGTVIYHSCLCHLVPDFDCINCSLFQGHSCYLPIIGKDH